jgi:hypothetical protein
MHFNNTFDFANNPKQMVAYERAKKSIGIQHQQRLEPSPTIVCMVVDRNSKTTTQDIVAAARAARVAVAARRSTSLFYTKSSLPDLTFLKDYSDERTKKSDESNDKTPVVRRQPAVLNEISLSKSPSQTNSSMAVGSDLLKRKTLKSIKRYRQTKQNTEPCVFDNIQSSESDQNLFHQYFNSERNENYVNQVSTLNTFYRIMKQLEARVFIAIFRLIN